MEKTVRERRQDLHALVGATEFGSLYDNEFLLGASELTGRFRHWLELEELLAGAFDAVRDGDVHPLRGLEESQPSVGVGPTDFAAWANRRIEAALGEVQTSPQSTPELLGLAEARAGALKRLVGLALPILQASVTAD